MKRRLTISIIGAALLVTGTATGSLAQTSVQLRQTATPASGSPLLLSDIATIRGDDAARLGQIVIRGATGAGGPGGAGGSRAAAVAAVESISIARVREALSTAGVNLGRVTISGSICTLAAAAPAPSVPVTARPAVAVPEAIDVTGAATVRRAIGLRLADLYGLPPGDVRVLVRANSRDDETLLGLGVESGSGRRVDVQPEATASSGRVPVRVDVYEGDRLSASRTVSVDVLVRRRAAVISRPVERERAIGAEDVTVEDRWLSPAAELPMSPEELTNQTARQRLEPGRVVTRDDVRGPMVVSRGDLVWVHCLSPGVAVRARARALESGRDGELVTMQLDGSKKTFRARMSGRGTAVIELPTTANDDASEAGADGVAAADAPTAAGGVTVLSAPRGRKGSKR